MRMLIIAVVALLVIGGGGAGAYFYLMPASPEDGTEVAEAKGEDDAHGGESAFVELDPFMLSVLGKNKAYETVSIAVVIEVKSESYVEEIEAKKPRITHYFLEEMYDAFAEKNGKRKDFSIEQIQDRLMKISGDVIGEDKVSDVLIQLISRHPV